jgi:DNA-binding transcriptional regulator YiaG
MKHTTKRPFDVYAPGTKESPPKFLQTIEVEVETRTGEEFLTQESRRRIEEIRTRHMGLISGEEIKAMRKRLDLSQAQLTALLDCGEKSLSRWENGHGYPTGIVNRMLRLLDEGFLAPASLEAVQGPRPTTRWIEHVQARNLQRKTPLNYRSDAGVCRSLSNESNQRTSELLCCP